MHCYSHAIKPKKSCNKAKKTVKRQADTKTRRNISQVSRFLFISLKEKLNLTLAFADLRWLTGVTT